MDPTTHGALITGSGFWAFIDGIPDTCQHDSDGPTLSFNAAGEYFNEAQIPDYHSDYEGWLEFQQQHQICGGCVSCSKCGKPFSPPLF